jgi:hypothetical protein
MEPKGYIQHRYGRVGVKAGESEFIIQRQKSTCLMQNLAMKSIQSIHTFMSLPSSTCPGGTSPGIIRDLPNRTLLNSRILV